MRRALYGVEEPSSPGFSLKIYRAVIKRLLEGNETRDYVWLSCMDWSSKVMARCQWGLREASKKEIFSPPSMLHATALE